MKATSTETQPYNADDARKSESVQAIAREGGARGLIVRDAADVGGRARGQVIAVSSDHVLVKLGEVVAMRFERGSLSRDVEVGEKVSIQYGKDTSLVSDRDAAGQRDRSHDAMHLERERGLSAS